MIIKPFENNFFSEEQFSGLICKYLYFMNLFYIFILFEIIICPLYLLFLFRIKTYFYHEKPDISIRD